MNATRSRAVKQAYADATGRVRTRDEAAQFGVEPVLHVHTVPAEFRRKPNPTPPKRKRMQGIPVTMSDVRGKQ